MRQFKLFQYFLILKCVYSGPNLSRVEYPATLFLHVRQIMFSLESGLVTEETPDEAVVVWKIIMRLTVFQVWNRILYQLTVENFTIRLLGIHQVVGERGGYCYNLFEN